MSDDHNPNTEQAEPERQAFWDRLHIEHPEIGCALQQAANNPLESTRSGTADFHCRRGMITRALEWAFSQGYAAGRAVQAEDPSFEDRLLALEFAVAEEADTSAALKVLVGKLLVEGP